MIKEQIINEINKTKGHLANMEKMLEECEKYEQALDDIEKFAKENVELLEGYHLEQANCLTILDIINKVKE